MPFYNTQAKAAFPIKPPREPGATKRHEYLHMTKADLIALCDERGVTSPKGTPVGRYQKKAYYVDLLVAWDAQHPTTDELTAS